MALYKGSKRIAGGIETVTTEDASDLSVTFSEGNVSSSDGLSEYVEKIDSFTTGSQLSKLMSLTKQLFQTLRYAMVSLNSSIDDLTKTLSSTESSLKSSLTVCYKDVSFNLTESNWTTSGLGLKYYNLQNASTAITGIAINAYILNWNSTAHLVTCSYYDNSYVQFRTDTACKAQGTVRIVYVPTAIKK